MSDESTTALNLCLNTRCNFCRETCSVYEVSKMEFDSPRAKLELINEALNDRVDPKDIMITLNRCTSCKKCVESCPYGIDTLKILNEFRNLVRDSELKKNEHEYVVKTGYPRKLISNFVEKGNPFGVKKVEGDIKKNSDIVLFPGCIILNEDKELLNKTKKILDKLNISYSISNSCCYSALKNFGFSKKEISEMFESRYKGGDKRIVTLCAGCYNSLKNDHGRDIIHITELLLDKIKKLNLEKDDLVTYIDSCKLGRYNQIYDGPRKVLESIKNLKIFDIENNMEDAPCCGGGGTLKQYFPAVSRKVTQKLLNQKAKGTTIVTGCSYCKHNINQNSDEKVKHVIDLVFESMR
ncbi:MAG: (Fe-S)-binding protein [Nanoarchaeota archaeon]|nr:(Fe-S)-binding protein [Nanoarchaeota archaeon]